MKLNSVTKFLWALVREVGEERAKDLIRGFVADLNEEAAELRTDEAKLDDLLKDIPEELKPVVEPALWAFAGGSLETKLQEIVGKIWAEAERINPDDAATPAPDVDLDGVEDDEEE